MTLFFARELLASQLNNHDRGLGCVKYEPSVAPTYGYEPSVVAGAIFTAVFFLSFLSHCVQSAMKRKWWYLLFAAGALGELIGWVGRTYAWHCPYNNTAFDLQISVLIIAPCFFSAGIYYLLGQLIQRLGPQYSPISAWLYLIIFASFDLLSIIIQAVGGASASKASSKTPPGDTSKGTNEMMAGIIIQLVSMSVFAMLWIVVIWRARVVVQTKKMSLLITATSLSAFCIIVRNFYRAVELSQGWKGYLLTHEVYFCVLDAALMVLASASFNIIHPAWILDETTSYRGTHEEQLRENKQTD